MFTSIGADQKHYGPVSEEEIRQWIRDGRADGRTLASREGTTDWKSLATFPEFAPYTSAQGLPPRLPGTTPSQTVPGISDAQLLAGEPDFDLGLCLGKGWELLMSNFGLLVGACLVVWVLDMAVMMIPLLGPFLSGVLYGGLYMVFLKRIRGEASSVGEALSGFSSAFVQLLLAGFLSTFLAAIASYCCLLPWVYLKIAWIFCLPLVMDKRLEFWTAMELSRKVVTRAWFKVFGLVLIAFAPMILFKGFVAYKTGTMMYDSLGNFLVSGTPDVQKLMTVIIDVARATAKLNLIAQVVVLVNLPFGTSALMYAYEALFSPRSTPAA